MQLGHLAACLWGWGGEHRSAERGEVPRHKTKLPKPTSSRGAIGIWRKDWASFSAALACRRASRAHTNEGWNIVLLFRSVCFRGIKAALK